MTPTPQTARERDTQSRFLPQMSLGWVAASGSMECICLAVTPSAAQTAWCQERDYTVPLTPGREARSCPC